MLCYFFVTSAQGESRARARTQKKLNGKVELRMKLLYLFVTDSRKLSSTEKLHEMTGQFHNVVYSSFDKIVSDMSQSLDNLRLLNLVKNPVFKQH